MNTVLAIEPGLAVTSVALFETAGWQRSEPFDRVIARLRMADAVRTAPTEPLPVRLRALAGGLDRILAEARNSLWAVSIVYLELPRFDGDRSGMRGRSGAGLSLHYLASGALISAAVTRGVDVRLVKASPPPRRVRHRCVLRALAVQHHPLGTERRPSAGLLDAIWLGATCLTSAKHQPQPGP